MKLNSGWAVFEAWAATASDDDVRLVQEVLLSLTDDTWATRFVHYDEVTSRGAAITVEARPNLVVVAWQLADYRDYFNVAFIGDPDDWD